MKALCSPQERHIVGYRERVEYRSEGLPQRAAWWYIHSAGSNKEVVMPIMMKRIGFIALGIVLVGSLSRAPVFAADKPVADGSKIMITSPKDGDKVGDSFELKYELVKGSQAGHVHVYVDNEYQRGFKGKLKGLSKGEHQITVKAANEDHASVAATHTITVDVQ